MRRMVRKAGFCPKICAAIWFVAVLARVLCATMSRISHSRVHRAWFSCLWGSCGKGAFVAPVKRKKSKRNFPYAHSCASLTVPRPPHITLACARCPPPTACDGLRWLIAAPRVAAAPWERDPLIAAVGSSLTAAVNAGSFLHCCAGSTLIPTRRVHICTTASSSCPALWPPVRRCGRVDADVDSWSSAASGVSGGGCHHWPLESSHESGRHQLALSYSDSAVGSL